MLPANKWEKNHFTKCQNIIIVRAEKVMRLRVDGISNVYGDLKFSGPYAALTAGF